VTPPTGYFSIRFLQQAVNVGAVDIYLVPSTRHALRLQAALQQCGPRVGGGLCERNAGQYTIVVTPTGVITTPYSSSSLTFVAGQVRTALIMDAQLTTNPPVTVVIGDDLN